MMEKLGAAALKTAIMIMALIGMLMLFSCRTTSGCEISYDRMVDTVYMNRVQKDSIYLHDSIYTREYMKGDTVCQYLYKETIKYVDRFRHDTTYIAHRDTVYRYIQKTVTKREGIWSRIKSSITAMVLLALVGGFIFFIIRKIRV